ncbi:transporter substrate-binding domain-containing protein [Motilimonas eburnea]|uniref:transporter substrate-binding domain-containing protein n=1 Tax=Motilimonas eburnea TaxID=1737488 RepID=UPI001E5C5DA4|nr:transporter substrate-binding domain-containing protein [Motilimonas eburnea]MCE2570449.1 transporter substrate-binding domain-containing protein [Motilimonas eburnea]
MAHAKQTIMVWDQLLSHPNEIVPKLLIKALDVTKPEYGDYELVPSEPMEQGRVIRFLAQSPHIDVAVFGPNKFRETVAIPVRFPVTGTLLSYRVCLIQQGKQSLFNGIANLNQLVESKLVIGQHQDWPDTSIMEANGLTLWKSTKYAILFDQLSVGRFDCFSRGANEIVQEFASHPDKGLAIEDNMMIYYPFPLFYFVNKAKPELAKRIELGLNRVYQSGEYHQMFKEQFGASLAQLHLAERNAIELTNPQLTPETEQAMLKFKQQFDALIKSVDTVK